MTSLSLQLRLKEQNPAILFFSQRMNVCVLFVRIPLCVNFKGRILTHTFNHFRMY